MLLPSLLLPFIMSFPPPVDVKPTVPIPREHADDEELDIPPESAAAGLWQLKIPKFLHERWERVLEPGVELGELVIDTTYVCSVA